LALALALTVFGLGLDLGHLVLALALNELALLTSLHMGQHVLDGTTIINCLYALADNS